MDIIEELRRELDHSQYSVMKANEELALLREQVARLERELHNAREAACTEELMKRDTYDMLNRAEWAARAWKLAAKVERDHVLTTSRYLSWRHLWHRRREQSFVLAMRRWPAAQKKQQIPSPISDSC